MLLVRETFVAKPGNASKLAKMFKESMAQWPGAKWKILTDLTGQFNRVIIEHEVESLTAYEKEWEEMMKTPPKENDPLKNYTEMYETGFRDIYRVW